MKHLIAILFSFVSVTAFAGDASTQVDEILKMQQEPEGVVFEIVTGKDDGLEWALPLSKKYIDQLKQRFPQMPIAIVTHGREQFALQKAKQGENAKVHDLTQQLEIGRAHV